LPEVGTLAAVGPLAVAGVRPAALAVAAGGCHGRQGQAETAENEQKRVLDDATSPYFIGQSSREGERRRQEGSVSADAHKVSNDARDPRFSARVSAIARGLGVLAVLFAILVLIDSFQAERVAADSQLLAASERSLSSTELIRANVGIGVLLASADAAGIDPTDRWPDAIARARQAHAQLLAQVSALEDLDLTDQAEVIGLQLDEIDSLLQAGEVDLADQAVRSELVRPLDIIAVTLLSTREVVGARIEAERSSAGNLARATSIAIAVLGLLWALLSYWAISRRRQREQEFEEAIASGHRLVAAKDQIINNLSHELRTPLTSIYGFASLLLEGLSQPLTGQQVEANRENAQIILSESSALSRMVDDLLTSIKGDDLGIKIKLVGLSARSEMEKVLQPFEREGARLTQRIEDAQIWVDGIRFRQVVRNLVANARRHGGPRIAVIGRVVGNEYELAVVDDGAGVPDALKARMFERFVHRGSEPLVAGSLGLGLSIARALTELMGGRLRYERSDGLTKFLLTFPLSAKPQQPVMIEALAP
jgi:signal transduction histidine kinase